MARGVSTRLLTTLPEGWSSSWLNRLDKRTKVARAVLNRIGELESDAGGADGLSAVRRSLIRHAAWLDAVVESHELRLAAGEEIDVGSYTQALNSLLGLYRLIGLERRQRRVESLRSLMYRDDPEPAGAGSGDQAGAEPPAAAEKNSAQVAVDDAAA